MNARLSLLEVDRLIDVLDNARLAPPRSEIETLHAAYAGARRVEERARTIYGSAILVVLTAWLCAGFANGALGLPVWVNFAMIALLALKSFALTIFAFLFPVLQRREGVAELLDYFDTDLTQIDKVFWRKTVPKDVVTAIETLERARSPDTLGPAYSVVERWSGDIHGMDFDSVYITSLWVAAMIVAVWGAQLGVSDMWRGFILGAASMAAFYHVYRTREKQGARRRAEDALGRWRHLVPNMRELPQ